MLADAGLSVERFSATPAPLYQILPVSWHRRWVAATHSINAVIARKVRRLLGYQFIVLANPKRAAERSGDSMSETRSSPKVVVVMPAYNAGRTLRLTYEELPKDAVNLVILVDDGSTDATLDVARQLGLEIFVHNRNYGYGANQKTCYAEALRAGADVVVMVHPDYQYDPRLVPEIIQPIVRRRRRRGPGLSAQGAARRSRRACRGGSTSPIAS